MDPDPLPLLCEDPEVKYVKNLNLDRPSKVKVLYLKYKQIIKGLNEISIEKFQDM